MDDAEVGDIREDFVSLERNRDVPACEKRSRDNERKDDIDGENSDSTRSSGRKKRKKQRDDEKIPVSRRNDRDHRRHEKKKKKRQYESDSSSSESRRHSKRSHKKSSKKHKKKRRKTDEKDCEGEVRRSVITGKKIQMKIDKTADDLVQDQARKQLLDFMNSSYK